MKHIISIFLLAVTFTSIAVTQDSMTIVPQFMEGQKLVYNVTTGVRENPAEGEFLEQEFPMQITLDIIVKNDNSFIILLTDSIGKIKSTPGEKIQFPPNALESLKHLKMRLSVNNDGTVDSILNFKEIRETFRKIIIDNLPDSLDNEEKELNIRYANNFVDNIFNTRYALTQQTANVGFFNLYGRTLKQGGTIDIEDFTELGILGQQVPSLKITILDSNEITGNLFQTVIIEGENDMFQFEETYGFTNGLLDSYNRTIVILGGFNARLTVEAYLSSSILE